MANLFENIASLEKALQKTHPKARLKWRALYYEALKYAPTPRDVQEMSFMDLLEFVGQKRRFYEETQKPQSERKKPGRKKGRDHAEDWWAWCEVNLKKRAGEDVKPEWIDLVEKNTERKLSPGSYYTTFKRIVDPKWGIDLDP